MLNPVKRLLCINIIIFNLKLQALSFVHYLTIFRKILTYIVKKNKKATPKRVAFSKNCFFD